MQEKLVALSFPVAAAADADDKAGITLPTGVGFTIVGVGYSGVKSAGSNAATVDIKDDGTEITGFTALTIAAAADTTTAFSKYVAGTAPKHLAAASVITWDLNLTSENITGNIILWGYFDEA